MYVPAVTIIVLGYMMLDGGLGEMSRVLDGEVKVCLDERYFCVKI